MSSEPSESLEKIMGEKSPRFVPGPLVWIAIAIFAAIGVFAWFQSEMLAEQVPMAGPAMSRVLIFGMTALSVLTLAGWLIFRSSHPVGLKVAVGLAVLAVPFVLRVEHSGDLFSTRVSLRWYAPDRALQLPDVPAAALESTLNVERRSDFLSFPQFLGPNRNGVISSFTIAPIWEPEVQWKKPVGAGWSGFTANHNVAFTQEQRGDDELVVSYDIVTGKPIWFYSEKGQRHDNELGGIGPRATPTLHRGRVFAMGGTGVLVCLDEGTGELIWKRNVITDVGSDLATDLQLVMWGRSGSPLIVDEMVVVPGGGKDGKFISLIGYSLETGEPVWKAGTDQISYGSPMLYEIASVRQIVVTNESNVAGYSVETGAQLWSHSRPGKSSGDANTSQPQLVGSDRLLITKGYGGGAELIQLSKDDSGVWTVTSLWANKKALNTKLTSAYVVDGYAYGLNNGVLECVNLANGESMWRKGRMGHGQVIVVGSSMVVLSEDGELYRVAVSPDGYEATEPIAVLDSICWNTLCVYGDLLLLRNNHEAACVRILTSPPEGAVTAAGDGRSFGFASATATLPKNAPGFLQQGGTSDETEAADQEKEETEGESDAEEEEKTEPETPTETPSGNEGGGETPGQGDN